MAEEKTSQTRMVELPKPGDSQKTVLVDPQSEDLPGWQKRVVDLMKEENISAQEALNKVKIQDAKEKETDRWFD